MAKLYLFLILFAFVSLEVYATWSRNKRDVIEDEVIKEEQISIPEDVEEPINRTLNNGEKETSAKKPQRGWQKYPTPGWQKTKPCGTPGRPCSSTTVTVVPPITDPTKPTTVRPNPNTKPSQPTRPIGRDDDGTPTPKPTRPPVTKPITPSVTPPVTPRPITPITPPFTKPITIKPPITVPTSISPVTPITGRPITTHDPSIIIFPDDNDHDDKTSNSPTKPTTPSGDVLDKEKEPVFTTKNPIPTPPPNVIRQCMLSCPVTSEYNPICGSDGVTYSNPGRLLCAQDCGVDVHEVSKGFCRIIKTTTSAPTTLTPPPRTLIECMHNCPMTEEYNPICGSDGVTYINPGELMCAQFCGVPVRLQTFGRCGIYWTTITPLTEPDDPDKVHKCLMDCRPTSEYDPVCGSNGILYPSPGRLKCAKDCGIKVEIVSKGPCPAPPRPTLPTAPPTPATTPNPASTRPTFPPKIRSCLERCPSTPESNPVCGTDGRTYENAGKLHCASVCGHDVTLLRRGPCIPGRRNRDRISTTTTSTTPAPIVQ